MHMKWPLIANRSRQQQTRQSEKSPSAMEGRIVKELNHPRDNTSAATIPSNMSQASPRPPMQQRFILLFTGIILKIVFYVFGDLNGVFENENVFELKCELECKFKNINCASDFYDYGDLFGGHNYLIQYPTYYPTSNPHPKPFDFINLRAVLHEQVVLKGVVGVNDNPNGFVYVMIYGCNENFYNNGCYYHPPYPTTTPGPTPTKTMIFNRIITEICKINILQCIFGIGLCENDNDNVICNRCLFL